MTLKIKDKKLFGRNFILYNFITRKFGLQGVVLWIKDPDPGPGDPKRPDPQHWFKGRYQQAMVEC